MATGTAILTCLTNYVGLQACEETEPGSSLFVNDLPGISSELVQMITEGEEETYLVTWAKIQQQAILMFRSKLLAQLNECYQINKMATVECIACENKELLSVALWYLMGFKITTWALNNWNNTRFSTVDRQSVEELGSQFYVDFEMELKNAVLGIDVENSDCIENEDSCIQANGRIHNRESMM